MSRFWPLLLVLLTGCEELENLLNGQAGNTQTPAGVTAVADLDFINNGEFDAGEVELGRLLFHDKILSGNQNISCSTCHHVDLGTSDGLSLSLGEGAFGLGPNRVAGDAEARVPRNSPGLFNLGLRRHRRLFHDGRVSDNGDSFSSPAGQELPDFLDNVLAVQAIFPLASPIEMAGGSSENSIGAAAADENFTEVWRLVVERLQSIDAYVELFTEVYFDVDSAEDIGIYHVGNAIAAYEAATFRSDNSPFDRFLRGDSNAMSTSAIRGMNLFYGGGRCSRCHSGAMQTDFQFHSIAMPQIGPGVGDGFSGLEDFGRERVTGDSRDRYEFRTPSLRNVALTGPWGHAGAYTSLRSMVEHYRNTQQSVLNYSPNAEDPVLPSAFSVSDFTVTAQRSVSESIAAMTEVRNAFGGRRGVGGGAGGPGARPGGPGAGPGGGPQGGGRLGRGDVDDILAFLNALTDPNAQRLTAPVSVPSGLSVD